MLSVGTWKVKQGKVVFIYQLDGHGHLLVWPEMARPGADARARLTMQIPGLHVCDEANEQSEEVRRVRIAIRTLAMA